MLQDSLLSLFHIASVIGGMVVFALTPVPPGVVQITPKVLVEQAQPCRAGNCEVLAAETQAVEEMVIPPSPTLPPPTVTIAPEPTEAVEEVHQAEHVDPPDNTPSIEKKSETAPPPPILKPTTMPQVQSNLNAAVNTYRQQNGKGNLQSLNELCQVAETRVKEITSNFSHDGYEALVAPLGYTSVAENIFYSSKYAVEENITAWHESSGHRENMLGNFMYGCGVERGGYAVFLFMSR
jgi:uncharacterized protein YkwD